MSDFYWRSAFPNIIYQNTKDKSGFVLFYRIRYDNKRRLLEVYPISKYVHESSPSKRMREMDGIPVTNLSFLKVLSCSHLKKKNLNNETKEFIKDLVQYLSINP